MLLLLLLLLYDSSGCVVVYVGVSCVCDYGQHTINMLRMSDQQLAIVVHLMLIDVMLHV